MNEYLICYPDDRSLTVYAASLASAGESFPSANVIQVNDMSRLLVRYIPFGNKDGSHQILSKQ